MFFEIRAGLPEGVVRLSDGTDITRYIDLSCSIQDLLDLSGRQRTDSSIAEFRAAIGKNNAWNVDKAILPRGFELTLNVNGSMTIKLEELTGGVLPDFSFTLGSANTLLTSGTGRSGLEAGIYMRFNSDFAYDLVNFVKEIINHYTGIFSALGIRNIKVPSVGIDLALFFTSSSIGFSIDFDFFSFKCIFIYQGTKFSCKVNADFFSMFLEAAKYVFKKSRLSLLMGLHNFTALPKKPSKMLRNKFHKMSKTP